MTDYFKAQLGADEQSTGDFVRASIELSGITIELRPTTYDARGNPIAWTTESPDS